MPEALRRLSRRMRVTCRARVLAALPLLLLSLPSDPVVAQSHPVLERHELACDATFPCPPELARRIDFWIVVFRKYTTDQALFHDSAVPERLFSVIDSPGACSGGRRIERERRRLRDALRGLAAKVKNGSGSFSHLERHLLSLFPDRDAGEIRAASGRVRCQGGNRDRFARALERYGAYRHIVQRALEENSLPADIQYLPFVESAYNPTAYSRAGAAGLWQIMPRTGRHLGLQLNASMDERFDPEAATWAAARYLRDSTDTLTAVAASRYGKVDPGALNPFVITSYNYGVAGMRRALLQVGPDYMTVLKRYRSSRFRTAVRNFYSSFLAARHVVRNADSYFGDIRMDRPLRYDLVALTRDTSVARIQQVFGVGAAELKQLNPALSRYVWAGYRMVPEGYPLRLPPRPDDWRNQVARLESLPPERRLASGLEYTVKRGDTACGIAKAFDVSCRELIGVNGLGRRALIRVGQKLSIPGRGPVAAPTEALTADGRYRVRPGDTACGIAGTYRVDCGRLIAANGLGDGSLIRVGQWLRIPGATGGSGEKGGGGVSIEYVVRRGDTPCGIASRHAVDCSALLAANGLGRRTNIYPGQTLRIPGVARAPTPAQSYTVRAGDSPCGIAGRFGIDCGELLSANGLGRRSVIHPGQELTLPGVPAGGEAVAAVHPAVYTVSPGDTPCGIAGRFDVACSELLAANGLGRRSVIHPGQQLRLPGVPAGGASVADARPAVYTVSAGDSPCGIAERFDVDCRTLLAANDLGRRSVIHPGQELRVPGVAAEDGTRAPGALAETVPATYTVRRGDTACGIARRFSVECRALVAANGLGGDAVIRVGQELDIPGAGVPGTREVSAAPAPEANQDSEAAQFAAILAGDVDYAVQTRRQDGHTVYSVRVAPDETLGHYADWLGIGVAGPIRDLNGLGADDPLRVGSQLRLPIPDADARARFEERRREYHVALVDEFVRHYEIVSVEPYQVRRGDSTWAIAARFDLPLWVVLRFNPHLLGAPPSVGETLSIPSVRTRADEASQA